jgi:glycosyltransferase involved in cell wall biosynthesis
VGKYFDIAFSAMQKQVSILNEYGYTAFFINHGLSNSFVHYSKERLERIAQPLYNPVQIHKMNVGYAGNLLSEPPNRNIMREVIEQNPGVTFHFWGQYEKNTIDNIGPAYFNPEFVTYLQTKSNVTLYGIVDTETLASQMQKMDMFWVCWKTADGSMWNADTNPHKIIEYLSTGKPVVSHYMSNYENYDILYMPPKNNTGYELLFNDVINKVKAGEPEELIKKRLFFALDNSYQNQLKLIEDKVNALQ